MFQYASILRPPSKPSANGEDTVDLVEWRQVRETHSVLNQKFCFKIVWITPFCHFISVRVPVRYAKF